MNKFYHTLGDTRPLVFRCKLNGSAYPLDGATVKLYAWKQGSGELVINGQFGTPDPVQSVYAGVVRFDYALMEAVPEFVAGVYKFRVVSTKAAPVETVTFPTGEFSEQYVFLTVNEGT